MCLKFGDVQLLDMLNFLGGATSLDSFLKANKTSETKTCFRMNGLIIQKSYKILDFSPVKPSFANCATIIPNVEKHYLDFQNLIDGGVTFKDVFTKLKLIQPHPTGQENYQYLISVWEQENRCTFKYSLCWCNNKDFVPTLKAMQKIVDFHHEKQIDMLKLGYTLPNLANVCLQSSFTAKFYPFTENQKDLMWKIREDMVGGPFVVYTKKTVVNEFLLCDSKNWCKSIVELIAGQFYPYAVWQAMPAGLYTRGELDSESDNFRPFQSKKRSFEKMIISYFRRVTRQGEVKCFYTTGAQKKMVHSCFCGYCSTVFEDMGWYYHFYHHFILCQESCPSLTDEKIQRRNKKIELDELRRQYLQEKGYSILEMWVCDWWKLKKQRTLLGSICENHSLQNASQRRMTFRKSNFEDFSLKFNVILKYESCCGKTMPTFHPSSGNLRFPEMTLVRLCKHTLRKKDFWLNLRKFSNEAFSWRMEQSLHHCCSFIWLWEWFAMEKNRFVQYTPKECFTNFA